MDKNKTIATIIICLVAAVIIFVFVLPKFQELQFIRTEVSKKQAEYNSKSVYFAKIKELLEIIDNKKESMEKINSALPSEISLAHLVYFFQQKALENGLLVKSITLTQISQATSETPLKTIVFTINFLGNYQSFKNFLNSLDKSAKLFEINSISFRSSNRPLLNESISSNQASYDFAIEVKTYSY